VSRPVHDDSTITPSTARSPWLISELLAGVGGDSSRGRPSGRATETDESLLASRVLPGELHMVSRSCKKDVRMGHSGRIIQNRSHKVGNAGWINQDKLGGSHILIGRLAWVHIAIERVSALCVVAVGGKVPGRVQSVGRVARGVCNQ